MTVTTIAHILKRGKKDVVKKIKDCRLVEKSTTKKQIQSMFFGRDVLERLRFEFNMKKVDYIHRVRNILEEYPFCTQEMITEHMYRPSSYTVWIITEMSYSEPDFAETDDGRLFLVNEKTQRMLDNDSMPVYNDSLQ